MAEEYSTVYTYHSFPVQSSVCGHLSCVHVLEIVNSSARSLCDSLLEKWTAQAKQGRKTWKTLLQRKHSEANNRMKRGSLSLIVRKGFKGREKEKATEHVLGVCTVLWLVGGWCFWGWHHQPSASIWYGVHVLLVTKFYLMRVWFL